MPSIQSLTVLMFRLLLHLEIKLISQVAGMAVSESSKGRNKWPLRDVFIGEQVVNTMFL